ncbi:hypothetical protein RFI_28698, partial [Reticulomyxa filosa]
YNVKGSTSKGVVFEEHLFEERDFVLGQAGHCKGVEMSLATMNVGDYCRIEIHSPEYSYGAAKLPEKCPANNDSMDFPLVFDVKLIDCMPPLKNSFDMTFREQLELVQSFRNKGNQRYENKRYQTAMRLYEKVDLNNNSTFKKKKAVQTFKAMSDREVIPEEKIRAEHRISDEEFKEEQLKCYMNCSACALQMNNPHKAIEYANNALQINPQAPKALMRRAFAYKVLHRLEDAVVDLEAILALPNVEPQAIETTKKQLNSIKKTLREAKRKEKQTFGGFMLQNKVHLYKDKSNNDDNTPKGWVEQTLDSIANTIYSAFERCVNCCRKKKTD